MRLRRKCRAGWFDHERTENNCTVGGIVLSLLFCFFRSVRIAGPVIFGVFFFFFLFLFWQRCLVTVFIKATGHVCVCLLLPIGSSSVDTGQELLFFFFSFCLSAYVACHCMRLFHPSIRSTACMSFRLLVTLGIVVFRGSTCDKGRDGVVRHFTEVQ